MDNRLRFLYCGMTELRGRIGVAWAGNGKPGASAGGGGEEKPPTRTQWRDAQRRKSSEACKAGAEKSRYCSYRTRTVNRHRWMGRES